MSPRRGCGRSCGAVWLGALLLTALTHAQPDETTRTPVEQFLGLLNLGKGQLDGDDAAAAARSFEAALRILPTDIDARLDLAVAELWTDRPDAAIEAARRVLALDKVSAPAYFIIGCASNRLGEHERAARALRQALALRPGVAAAHFQLGVALREGKDLEGAVLAWRDAIALEPDHLAAHYTLSQALFRLGRREEAQESLRRHQENRAARGQPLVNTRTFEACALTAIRIPEAADQPRPAGIPIVFRDITTELLPDVELTGPIAIVDVDGDGRADLVARDATSGALRLLRRDAARFAAVGADLPLEASIALTAAVTGDLDNDGHPEVLVVGPHRLVLARCDAERGLAGATAASGLVDALAAAGEAAGGPIRPRHVTLVDLDHTGKLDVVLVGANGAALLRNRGDLTFEDRTAESGLGALPRALGVVRAVDWDSDRLLDLLVGRADEPVLLLRNQFLGAVELEEVAPPWPTGRLLAVDDLNNDLRPDLVVATADGVHVQYGAGAGAARIGAVEGPVADVCLVDIDNDGWLDVCTVGGGVHLWRNRGLDGFEDVTAATGLAKVATGSFTSIRVTDVDGDGDRDLLLTGADGLRVLSNEGGSMNRLLRLALTGTRSNRSGLGVTVEIRSGRFRTARTVQDLPIEIGIGRRDRIDALTVVWSDQIIQSEVNLSVSSGVVALRERLVTSASCPFVYAWDGTRFRFVSDFLGTAPLGLRRSDDRFVAADVDEFVWIGDTSVCVPRNGRYVLQLTEELREALYLDEAKLVVVDHPADTEVHPTDKLQPPPFAASALEVLHLRVPLVLAHDDAGADVTAHLDAIDGRVVSPSRRRRPQLRGLAEPFGITMTFAALPRERPLVLALTGWLMWGGATSNVAASHDTRLPPPFPTLAVETASGVWQPVEVMVGAPAGRTKTILVDLAGGLPPGARRLRLTTGLELHWDRVALFERADTGRGRRITLDADRADLHHRGMSVNRPRQPDEPIIPVYDDLRDGAPWPRVPSGAMTRYGDTRALLATRDGAFAVLGCGDEVTLEFDAARLPPVAPGDRRDFFLFTVGWDKDADYHVEHGWTVEPMPFHGMIDDEYGHGTEPPAPPAWAERLRTRWMPPFVRTTATAQPAAPAAGAPAGSPAPAPAAR